MFKSDALGDSHLQNHNLPKNYQKYNGYQEAAPNAEEFNTSRFSGIPVTAARPGHNH